VSAALRLWAIGGNTLREAVRNRLLYALLFFAIVIIAAGVLISTLSYVERERILQDVGFAAIRVFGAGIAIFVGVGLIHREVERRTIYTILSKPISRSAFLFGKYLGLVVTMWLMLAVMGAAFGAISLAMGAPFDAAHLAALALIGVELALIVAVTTLFSSFTTPFLASLFSVGIWVLGHGTRELRQLGRSGDLEGLGGLTTFVYRVLPDLEAFNLTLEAVHGLAIPAAQIAWPIVYGVAYSAALLCLAAFVFERRDFR
jgi:ABC-type transport system involved in multi-copper enzyme maturation permease subunit